MEHKQTNIAAVKRALAKRRERALMEAEIRKAELYEALPQLVEYDNQVINTGIRAAQLAASGTSPEALQEAMEETGKVQEARKNFIESHGYSIHTTDPVFTCPLCKDTGRVNGVLCSCYQELLKKTRSEQINRSFPLAVSDFSSFSLQHYSDTVDPAEGDSPRHIMAQILEYCKSYAKNFDTRCKSLFLMGTAGLGKTHLALSIAKCALEKNFDVVYVSAQDAFIQIEKEKFNAGGELLSAMLEAELLIVDDLGTEFITPFVLSTLYQIVNTRMGRHLPTIYTTNITTQQMLITRYTEKVASRLLGSCEILRFTGRDVRLKDL